MGVEHDRARFNLRKAAPDFILRHGKPLIRYFAERITEASPIIYPEGFSSVIKQAALENYFFLFYSNHISHFDPMAESRVIREATFAINSVLPQEKQSKGVLMPIAISVGNGAQDALLTIMYESVWPILEQNRITPVDMSRVKDRDQYDIPLNRRGFTKEMLRNIKAGYRGIILYPEGTVQGGRSDPDGRPNGMQPFAKGSLATFTAFGEHATGKVIYIPMGIDGSLNIIKGDKRPPISSVIEGLLLPDPSLTIVRVGMPVRSDGDELRGLTNGEKDEVLAGKVVQLIPPRLQGVYKHLAKAA